MAFIEIHGPCRIQGGLTVSESQMDALEELVKRLDRSMDEQARLPIKARRRFRLCRQKKD